MLKYFVSLLLLISIGLNAQNKKPVPGKNPKNKKADSLAKAVIAPIDTIDAKEMEIKAAGKFAVYTKRKKVKPTDKMKLCINLVSPENSLFYCMVDSICKDPEVSKILFEKKDGDTTYVLILVDAFSKEPDRPSCDSGKETKLLYARWNTKTNKAVWRQKIVSSCIRAVTNMTKEPIQNWDGKSPLTVNYHKGGTNFVDVTFDPEKYQLGFQTTTDGEGK